MPWELTILKYDGEPPRMRRDAQKERELPLGTLAEVKGHITEVMPGTEWYEEPSLIEIMKMTGSDTWKDWDDEMIAASSEPKIKAHFESGDTSFEMFGFEADGPIRHFLMDIRGNDNPISTLRALCLPKRWSVAEMSRDGEFLALSGNSDSRWNAWLGFLGAAIKKDSGPSDATH